MQPAGQRRVVTVPASVIIRSGGGEGRRGSGRAGVSRGAELIVDEDGLAADSLEDGMGKGPELWKQHATGRLTMHRNQHEA